MYYSCHSYKGLQVNTCYTKLSTIRVRKKKENIPYIFAGLNGVKTETGRDLEFYALVIRPLMGDLGEYI